MTNKTTVALTRDLREATENLAENLLHAEPFLAFTQTKSRLDADGQASGLLAHLSTAQAELRTLQARNEVRQEDIENVRATSFNDTVIGSTLCPMGDAWGMPIRAMMRKFRSEFESLIR